MSINGAAGLPRGAKWSEQKVRIALGQWGINGALSRNEQPFLGNDLRR